MKRADRSNPHQIDGTAIGRLPLEPWANSFLEFRGAEELVPTSSERMNYAQADFKPLDHPEKVGIGTWDIDGKGTALSDLDQFNFGWYTNWQAKPLWSPDGTGNGDKRFVPMIWGGEEATKSNLDSAKDAASGYLLGFNEPDRPGQADMSVAQAIKLWPSLMKTGLELGSPACTTTQTLGQDSWLGKFMERADARHYDVDFISVHYYTDNPSISDFKAFLKDVRSEYGRPVWVTEWALVDWDHPNHYSSEELADFASAAMQMMDDLSFVKRHAWFGAYDGGDGWHINTELLDTDGNLTAVGKLFHDLLL